jgi:hypothetical protein
MNLECNELEARGMEKKINKHYIEMWKNVIEMGDFTTVCVRNDRKHSVQSVALALWVHQNV